MSVREIRWMMVIILLCVVFLAGPVYGDEGGNEVSFFQKMKNKINSWGDDDGAKAKKDVKKTVKKAEKSTKKEVKKTSPQGQSGGRKVLSFITKRANKASDNIQKSVNKDKKTLSRKLKTSGD